MSIAHDQMPELLHAYVDGEVDLVSGREVEQHLRTCASSDKIERLCSRQKFMKNIYYTFTITCSNNRPPPNEYYSPARH